MRPCDPLKVKLKIFIVIVMTDQGRDKVSSKNDFFLFQQFLVKQNSWNIFRTDQCQFDCFRKVKTPFFYKFQRLESLSVVFHCELLSSAQLTKN